MKQLPIYNKLIVVLMNISQRHAVFGVGVLNAIMYSDSATRILMFATLFIAVNAKSIMKRTRVAFYKKLCSKRGSIAYVSTTLKHVKMINWMSEHDFMCPITSVCGSRAHAVRMSAIWHAVKSVDQIERRNGVSRKKMIAWPTSLNGFSQRLTTNMLHTFGHIMLPGLILTLSIIICALLAAAQKPT
jgi:hypothetical protein